MPSLRIGKYRLHEHKGKKGGGEVDMNRREER